MSVSPKEERDTLVAVLSWILLFSVVANISFIADRNTKITQEECHQKYTSKVQDLNRKIEAAQIASEDELSTCEVELISCLTTPRRIDTTCTYKNGKLDIKQKDMSVEP